MDKKRVTILMSTYNGEKYLREQIDSVLNQRDVTISLFVRDDGSSDNTISVLKEYEKNGLLSLITGSNLGYIKSFMHLLKTSPDSDYYAFCDQDDVWEEDKLIEAVSILEKENANLRLYCSNTKLVDAGLNYMRNEDKKPIVSLGSSMIKNFSTGCTMVFNKELAKIVNNYNPDYVSSHDSWITRVCLALDGYVYFDKNAYIKYRQHGNNVVGSSTSSFGKIKFRIRRALKDKSRSRKNTALMLLQGYEKGISKDNRELLEKIAKQSFFQKINLLLNPKVSCGKKSDDILFKLALIMGWV